MLAASRLLLVLLLTLFGSIHADDAQNVENSDLAPLQDSDLEEIKLQIINSNPELASSPGVKVHQVLPGAMGSVDAEVIFHPHADSGGVKEALGVVCSRSTSDQPWSCAAPVIRRYYQIDGQSSGFRVIGELLGPEELVALVEATRTNLPKKNASNDRNNSCKALTVRSYNEGYMVTWRCEGTLVTMYATETPDADLTRSGNWQAIEYNPPPLRQR